MTTNNVTLSASMRQNLLSLQRTQKSIDNEEYILSTGKKINSALDDPTKYFSAQSLSNRATDLSDLESSMAQALKGIEAASNGITSITTLVNQAKSIATSAKSQATGGVKYSGSELAGTELPSTALGAGTTGSFTIQVGSGLTSTINVTAGTTTYQNIVDSLNTISGVVASYTDDDGDGQYALNINTTNGKAITLGGTGATLTALGVTGGLKAATNSAPSDYVTMQSQYNELLNQISDMAGDSGYQGVNLLAGGSLTVQYNEDNTSNQTVNGKDISATGLNMQQADFSTMAGIQASLDQITKALATLRAESSRYGTSTATIQSREDFTKNLVNTLKNGSDALTVADTNEESANLLSLQTTQSLGINALSLANQSSQSVLKLFQ